MFELLVSISEKNFSRSESLNELLKCKVAGVRFNLSRESPFWIKKALSFLVTNGFSPEKAFIDVGNNKARLSLNIKYGEKLFVNKNDVISLVKLPLEDDDKNNETWTAFVANEVFFNRISEKDRILVGDGELELTVDGIDGNIVNCSVLLSGFLKTGASLFIYEKDSFNFHISTEERDSVNRILKDFPCSIILSFVESPDNIKTGREVFPKAYEIVPKIESRVVIKNLDDVLMSSSKILIGRGDLGLSVGIERIGLVQSLIVKQSKKYGTDVYVATEILESINFRNIPLRCEVVDFTNLILSGVKGIVLTSETASSANPFECIKVAQKIVSVVSSEASKYVA